MILTIPSHLTRGAWIEIVASLACLRVSTWSHLTRGAWIEITTGPSCWSFSCCRTSHEVRGLKYWWIVQREMTNTSHLTRGAWIEILIKTTIKYLMYCRTSHEVRGLKFRESFQHRFGFFVAPHTRCVD